jgi:hypothetical protein
MARQAARPGRRLVIEGGNPASDKASGGSDAHQRIRGDDDRRDLTLALAGGLILLLMRRNRNNRNQK